MGTAGGSARREYERRRARDAAQRRSNRWARIAVTLATPILVYAAARFAAPAVLDGFFERLAESGGVDGPRSVDREPWHIVGLLVAAVATASVAREMWGTSQSTKAWGKGSVGEVATGRFLERLPRDFTTLHDVQMPGSRANIDHVVVGPTGVFTIETKNYRGGVRIARGRVTVGGRRRDGISEQAARQAHAVSARTGRPVRPIVVIHGGVQLGWFSSPLVDGVRFSGPGRLRRLLTSGARALSVDDIADVVARLSNAPPLAPATTVTAGEGCSCGGQWIERRRRSDGARFLGCSRFPACKRTLSLR